MRLSHSTLLPVGLGFEVLVPARFPVAIGPAVVAEFRSAPELVLGDVGDVPSVAVAEVGFSFDGGFGP